MKSRLRFLAVGAEGLFLCIQAGAAFALSWLPERTWYPVTRLAAGVAAQVADWVRPWAGPDAARRTTVAVWRWHARLPVYRTYRPGGWNPALELVGREHIEAALAAGHGAILWVHPANDFSFLTKRAIARSGYRLYQLSHEHHGVGPQPVSVRLLNPMLTRVEDRYLAGRILLGGHLESAGNAEGVHREVVGAMRAVREKLLANQLVAITVGSQGRDVANLPVRRGEARIATGPIHLAASTGAALLPVFVNARPGGGYRVWVEGPLAVPAGRRADLAPVLSEYLAGMRRHLRRFGREAGYWGHGKQRRRNREG